MKYFIISIILLLLLTPLIIQAQEVETGAGFDNPVSSLRDKSVSDVSDIVGTIIRIVLGLLGVIALILFISAGFTWMTAQGNSEKIAKAQGIMAWAGIGLLIIFSSYALLNFVFNII